jgi:hypothetical protein
MSPSKPSYPCGKCGKEVLGEGIKCDVCTHWMHQGCSKLTKATFILYCREKKLTWVCVECRNLARMAIGCEAKTGEKSRQVANNMHSGSKPDKETPSKEGNSTKTIRACNSLLDNDSREEMQDSKLEEWTVGRKVKELQKEIEQVKNGVGTELNTLKQQLHMMRGRYELATGRNRNVLIHGLPEHSSKIPHVRRKAHFAFVQTLLRNANLSLDVKWKRSHRVGRWRGLNYSRPLLVEFYSQKDRDLLLSRSKRIYSRVELPINITPDLCPEVAQTPERSIKCAPKSLNLDLSLTRLEVEPASEARQDERAVNNPSITDKVVKREVQELAEPEQSKENQATEVGIPQIQVNHRSLRSRIPKATWSAGSKNGVIPRVLRPRD